MNISTLSPLGKKKEPRKAEGIVGALEPISVGGRRTERNIG